MGQVYIAVPFLPVVQSTAVVTFHHGSKEECDEAECEDEMPDCMLTSNEIGAEQDHQGPTTNMIKAIPDTINLKLMLATSFRPTHHIHKVI